MPLPFLLAGAALAAAGYGVKKGVDAKSDLDHATTYNNRAKNLAEEFEENLEKQKTGTMDALQEYGELKRSGTESINSFQSLFDVTEDTSIQNDFKESKRIVITKEEEIAILKEIGVIDQSLSHAQAEEKINTANIELNKMTEGLKSVAAGSLAGVAAGGGAYLGVGSLATASTGTAISGLSGAAATNATLAWLGGGSLASGGFGMAGGTMVLGGLVVGPLLAIGGSVFAYKAAQAKDEAYSRYLEIIAQVDKGKIVISKLAAIQQHTSICISTFGCLLSSFNVSLIPQLKHLANDNLHYADMEDDAKHCVMSSYAMAYLLKDFIAEGTINEQGDDVNPRSVELVQSERVIKLS
ncbi:TPA: hypothetical protein I7142_16795 [Vibrio vulnificus]|uniref:hypothetical protein n=1 Tax=Vibrio vulnificus TaxID=672 RepID=UPI0018656EAC|nr:hypothetical protein [Vibrio vulnificus]EGR7942990.1 hypothetical protein [Vibrio vulnificus]ELH4810979.1 hypothetical protein [Vibrio vulnificus]ELV8667284.1 hypothetical protein [Vibrio vulnificus]ELV8804588.1 hypothetical protein [Vibrio vulnificus]MCU8409764.1 hypothetical protein [Vibrio vulnificus]